MPAPDGYNLAPWWLPRRKNRGSGGGGIKTRSVFRDAVPRRRFAYFADAGKVGRPAGRNYPPSPSTDKIPTYPFRSLTKRADNIRPYEGSQPCYGGRPQAAPTEVLQYKAAGGLVRCIFPKVTRRAQRRSAASQEVLCQAFFQESLKALTGRLPGIKKSGRWGASRFCFVVFVWKITWRIRWPWSPAADAP